MNIGDKVVVKSGHLADEPATIVRRDKGMPYYFVTIDRYADDRTYRDMEYGPFVASELAVRN